ncbi:MAG: hypothetical protein L6R28_07185 [Planctomycetes bacterium]|nr:hypothetical protein [Planctomycetota bacterium]
MFSTISKILSGPEVSKELPPTFAPGAELDVRWFELFDARCRKKVGAFGRGLSLEVDGELLALAGVLAESKAARASFVEWEKARCEIAACQTELAVLEATPRAVASVKKGLVRDVSAARVRIIADLLDKETRDHLMRGRAAQIDVRALLRSELRRRLSAAAAPADPSGWKSEAAQVSDGRRECADLLADVALLSLLPSDLEALRLVEQPGAMGDEERATRVAALGERLNAADKALQRLEDAPGRWHTTQEGSDKVRRDLWLAGYVALRLFNARAAAPCDHLGRRKETPEHLNALGELGIGNALASSGLFVPTDRPHDLEASRPRVSAPVAAPEVTVIRGEL